MRRVVFYEPAMPGPYLFRQYPMPRMGVMILGTILKKAGYEVTIYVDSIRPPTMEELCRADLVGISTITPTAPRAYQVASALRARGMPVVLGGPHVTLLPDEAIRYADYVFRGEAENVIVQLVEAVLASEGLEQVPGLSFRRDDEVVKNPPSEPVSDLDALPAPGFDLLKGSLRLIVPVQTSRGCPHSCAFCNVPRLFGRKYRFRSTERVLDELSGLDLRGRRVFFYDDHFAANRPRLYELLEGMLSRGLKFSWSAQVRGDVAGDERLLGLMRRANCRTLYVGMESVNPETLKAYGKGQTIGDIEQSIRMIHKHGIRIYGMFVLGADTDTVETVRATANFARQNGIESVQFLILTPFPGTAYRELIEQQGRILQRDWSLYDAHHVVFRPARMSAGELHTEIVRALRKFYSVPRIISDILRFRFFEAKAKTFNRWYHVRAAQGAL